MVFITGDTHGDFKRFSSNSFPEQKEMTKEDHVIILGDFGGIWTNEPSKHEEYWLDWLDDKPFTTLFIDGNHENHPRLLSYPTETYHNGHVNVIRPSVLHLKRGEIFNIEDRTFFAFGGASSHDVEDGILDYSDPDWKEKAKKLDSQNKYMYRVKGLSWWEEELPTQLEMSTGIHNLSLHNNSVDYILTHCCSASTTAILGAGTYKQDVLTRYLQVIQETTSYRHWFFGHHHLDKHINAQEHLLYKQIIRLL